MALSRRKKWLFACVTVALSFAGMLALLLAADLVLHYRAERSAGLNRNGYRGPIAGRKRPGETRIVMLGGSTVFGYGVSSEETVASYLESRLRGRLDGPVRVINLGFNNEGAFAFLPHLQDFAYLEYDVVILYEGYNDLIGDAGVNREVYSRNSAVYRLFGYYPILPLYLDEKAMLLRNGGNLDAGYAAARSGQTVFRPTLAQRTGASALDAVAMMTKTIESQLARVSAAPATTVVTESALGCPSPWLNYCESVAAAIRFALARGNAVVVGSQPRIGGDTRERHEQQQQALKQMVSTQFAGEKRVVWVDLSREVRLDDTNLTFDGMHLTPGGNDFVAGKFVDPVLTAAAARGRS